MKEKKTITNHFSSLPSEVKIEKLYQCATALGCPVAIWSLPNTNHFHVLIDLSEQLEINGKEIEKVDKGFVFSPFSNESLGGNYFLKADLLYSSLDDNLQVDPLLDNHRSNRLDKFLSILSHKVVKKVSLNHPIPTPCTTDYVSLVAHAIDQIKMGKYDKLVLSRNKRIKLSDNFDPIEKLFKLRETYQNAFCYLLNTAEFGSWMAATPETLIYFDEQLFETVALAGTQKLDKGANLNHISWTQKEIEEQAMVSRYIINSFKKIRLREFDEVGPKTVKAGNLAHLKTTFKVKYKEINFPELGSVMLKLLHPTSAVCGMPLQESREYIHQREGFDRSLFAGFLGPVNISKKTNIYVNLRTMQFNSKEALLYAGAGITEDSVPQKEFTETEMKMNTLLNVIT